VEAGLRTGDRSAPYPEEVNRALIGRIADYHYAPTERARMALAAEGVRKNVWVVGNTVIDALLMGLELIQRGGEGRYLEELPFLDAARRIILVTGHRRESFGTPLLKIMSGIKQAAEEFPDTDFVYPVHPNPNVKDPVERVLTGHANVHLIPPLDYPNLIWLMKRAFLVVTDSGGIQEEAPSLGKPVLVTRDVTERVEGIEAGTAKLVGTDGRMLAGELRRLMTDQVAYRKMATAVNPYGNGTSSQQIAKILSSEA
jgi:UDP-N-acetylglucosamine 2-epimerase (non-hydrolysing)